MVRIFILEDSAVIRKGVKALLNSNQDFTVVGESGNGSTAVQEVLAAKPDVVLVDIGLPGASGIDVAREFKQRAPEIKALMFTSHEDEEDMFDSFAAGADGYLLKQKFNHEILNDAVNSVMKDKCWLDPGIATRVLLFCERRKVARLAANPSPGSAVEPLTVEEERVLQAAGCSSGMCSVDPSFFARLHRFAKHHDS